MNVITLPVELLHICRELVVSSVSMMSPQVDHDLSESKDDTSISSISSKRISKILTLQTCDEYLHNAREPS